MTTLPSNPNDSYYATSYVTTASSNSVSNINITAATTGTVGTIYPGGVATTTTYIPPNTWIGGPSTALGSNTTIPWPPPSATQESLDNMVKELDEWKEVLQVQIQQIHEYLEEVTKKVDALSCVFCKTCGVRVDQGELHICLTEMGRKQEESSRRLTAKLTDSLTK